MAYTLKSNATTAAASALFVGENGLTNLVSGGGAITATGANMTASTVGGHTVYGDGASGASAAQYLTAASVGAIGAGVKFAVLLVGHPSYDANDDDNYIVGPGSTQFGTGTGTVLRSVIAGNTQRGQAATGWNTGLHTTIWGRDSSNAIRHYFDGTGSSPASGASAWTVSAGSWNFGGTPNGGTNAGYGVGLFAVFIGVGPDELATYIAGAADAYAALLDSTDTTPPTLSSPTGAATGSTTATVGATTDEANGTLYAVVTTSATQPSVAQIKAGQNDGGTAAAYASSQAISSTGAKTFSATGLTASTAYYAHFVHADSAGNNSNRVSSSSFTTSAAGDTTPPTLSSAVGTQTGPSTATVGATTNEGNGTLYAVVTTSATAPSAAQVMAGQSNTGAAAAWAGNLAISSTGAKTLGATGLSGATAYYAHLMHRDASSNNSTVLSSASFTTAANASVSVTLTNNTGTLIASTSIPKVGIYKLSDMTLAVALTSQSTNGSGVLSISNAALTVGVDYIVLASDATGANLGAKKVTAA